jgi:isoamylase
MFRIDSNPTDSFGDFKLRPGKPLPFGATLVPGGVNFSVFSRHATGCELALFRVGEDAPLVCIPFPESYRIGNVFAMVVFDLDIEEIEYAYRFQGPFEPAMGHRFDPERFLMDPYAKLVAGRERWGQLPDWNKTCQYRSRVALDDFDWEGDRFPDIPMQELVIYELHVRGFTAHPSSGVTAPGTYSALREKIPYLKSLGINCVELMPIQEFDEFDGSRVSPVDGRPLLNYWGYSTSGFFAPKAGYAATGHLGMQADELKHTIREFHRNGIEVILDVVFNHTAEGNEQGPYISFRGVDNKTYYMLTPEGYYYNFSGCGNTLNCNNPIVRNFILDCLRYWVSDYHIDGFRFDLASILGRDQLGAPMGNAPLLERLAHDPILGRSKLIAEAWDAGGLYQVGSFPSWGRWAEWNGKYRDDCRRFLKGDPGMVGVIADRMCGSPDLYHWSALATRASVNFITCHDGFTLHDLVSYNDKHNEANGEDNRDGGNDNHSWNCGAEGPTSDPEIVALRLRQIKNAFAMLLLSQGTPMILSGDELANSQSGNNNAYCQDNEIGWLDWTGSEFQSEVLRFCQAMIAFRHAHPLLRRSTHLTYRDLLNVGVPDVSFHGLQAWCPDFSTASRTLAIMFDGEHARLSEGVADNSIYIALNMHWEAHEFTLPKPFGNGHWHVAINTGMPAPFDVWEAGTEPALETDAPIVGPRSIMVLIAK